MLILGIDPGIAITGFGILEKLDGKCRVVKYGALETHKSLPEPERLHLLQSELKKIIDRFSPDIMAVEKLFFFKNQKTIISVGEARGVVVAVGAGCGLEMREYTPLQVKQAVTGYGRADKKQIQMMVKNILKLSSIPKPDDVADALAVALCCASSVQFERRVEDHS